MRDTAISQLRRGVIEFCVLALLRDSERYGFELVQALAEAGGLVTTEGTLYPLLGRLRRDGVVETTWRESPSGPPRRYYRLTPSGHAALVAFVSEWTRFRSSVDALLETGAPNDRQHPASPRHRLPGARTPRRTGPAKRPPAGTAPGHPSAPGRAIAPEAHNAETLTILDRLGEPEEIIAAAWTRPPSRQPRPPTDTTPPSPHQLR